MERNVRDANGRTYREIVRGNETYVYGPRGGCLGHAGPSGTYNNLGGRVSPSNAPGFLYGRGGR